ncbi:hypothetical protein [Herbaspirillum sp. C9C3]|uniref:BrnT family toxin n=1 Tax=Herbaspirillum sp. C9C3 TaxID=2735271 RepID=UPI0015856655|nr:hypothetical protein [Herbaspirillum sp. C9C3]NUT63515.1 hypothetical protein [Herbaspirillum sp. C9C3]
MDIVFDSGKDAANLAKHGVSLALAAEMDWDDALIRTDDRRRMISLRKANQREFQLYAEN